MTCIAGGPHWVTYGDPSIPYRDADEEIREEFVDSKRTLEAWTGAPCRFLAFPAIFIIVALQIARECGYEPVFTANVGTVSSATDLFDIKRLIIEGAFTSPSSRPTCSRRRLSPARR